jgi:hypothetical protein
VRTEASLGGILLGALAITLLVFLVSSAIQESRNLIEWNRHSKALQAQRDLADRAEASRFTDLRQHIDATLRETRQRESITSSEFEKAMLQSQREMRAQLEQINRMLASRLGNPESRFDSRLHDTPAPRNIGDVQPGDARPTDVHPGDDAARRRLNV